MASSEKLSKVCNDLKLLYAEADRLMKSSGTDPSDLVSLLNKAGAASLQLEKLAVDFVSVVDSEERKRWTNLIKDERVRKVEFDARTAAWLKDVGFSEEQVKTVLSQPPMLRSSKVPSSYASTTSSARRAKIIANEEIARLKLEQLKQQQEMEREAEEAKRQLAEQAAEVQRRREVLKATHELQAASIERQVWEEECERGGYIFPERSLVEEVPPVALPDPTPFVPVGDSLGPNATTSGNLPKFENVLPEGQGLNTGSMSQKYPTTAPTQGEPVYAVPYLYSDHLGLPKPELIKFDVNPTQYPRFISNFDAHIARKLSGSATKLQFLIQHCQSEARRLIKFCSILDPDHRYQNARYLLYQNYGRAHLIARACVNRLSKDAAIKAGHATGLKLLTQEVKECSTTLSYPKYYSDLKQFRCHHPNYWKTSQRFAAQIVAQLCFHRRNK